MPENSADKAQSIQVISAAIVAGLLFAAFFGIGAVITHRSILRMALIGFVIAFVLVQLFARVLPAQASALASHLFLPTGSSTPAPPEYSLADSFAIRGQYELALHQYESDALEHPTDPEPFLRGARLLAHEMHRPEDALTWYRRALQRTTPKTRIATLRGIVDVCTVQLNDPARAAPDLARFVDESEPSNERVWAVEQLKRIKDGMTIDD